MLAPNINQNFRSHQSSVLAWVLPTHGMFLSIVHEDMCQPPVTVRKQVSPSKGNNVDLGFWVHSHWDFSLGPEAALVHHGWMHGRGRLLNSKWLGNKHRILRGQSLHIPIRGIPPVNQLFSTRPHLLKMGWVGLGPLKHRRLGDNRTKLHCILYTLSKCQLQSKVFIAGIGNAFIYLC